MTWTYDYGTHGELLRVIERKPSGDSNVWAEWTWTGAFGAKRTVAPTLYGSHVSTEDYSYDAQGRASKHVQYTGREIEFTLTYNYDCAAKTK